MNVAVHPAEPSAALTRALAEAHIRWIPVADTIALTEREPDGGWEAIIVELGDDSVTTRLAFARRASESGVAPVLAVAAPEHHHHLIEADIHDFVFSPVQPLEIAVRCLRLSGRAAPPSETLHFKDLTLDMATYQATIEDHPIDLTFMEYELLRFFVSNPGRVWSREQLLSKVWGYDYFGGSRTVDVHVRRLRAKLGEERAPWITTVRSVGYRFG